MTGDTPLVVRRHGKDGPPVVLVHGGPGAPGCLEPLARDLSDAFLVFEPHQRGSGTRPLTVARHVTDLADVVDSLAPRRPSLVGHSWGAMLALAYAAQHPDGPASLALVGCGTFDPTSRRQLEAQRQRRLGDQGRARLQRLQQDILDPDARLRAAGELLREVDAFDSLPTDPIPDACDAQAHEETWRDMIRLQDDGTYPAAFRGISCPVLMIHGEQDPHPGEAIHRALAPLMPQMQHRSLERCGHEPWNERLARDAFLEYLTTWLHAYA